MVGSNLQCPNFLHHMIYIRVYICYDIHKFILIGLSLKIPDFKNLHSLLSTNMFTTTFFLRVLTFLNFGNIGGEKLLRIGGRFPLGQVQENLDPRGGGGCGHSGQNAWGQAGWNSGGRAEVLRRDVVASQCRRK